MAYDGNGKFELPVPQFPAIPDTTIMAEDFNIILEEIAAALSSALVRDGQAPMTGPLNMGGQGINSVPTISDIATITAVVAGLVIAGKVSFSGAVTFLASAKGVTQAPGTNTTDLATCAFVLAQAMNTALPLQAGNANKALFTDGTNATWQMAFPDATGKDGQFLQAIGGSRQWAPVYGPQKVTANGTLAFGTYMFTGNYAVTLPDLTQNLPMELSVPMNAVAVPATITTSDGWSITTGFAAGTSATIMPLLNTTPHGWWGGRPMTPPVLGTRSLTGLSGSASTIYSSVILSSGLMLVAFVDNSATPNLVVVCIDTVTGAVGTHVSISGGMKPSLVATGANSFAMFYNKTSDNTAQIYAGTIAGTTITGASTQAFTGTGQFTSTPARFGTSNTFLMSRGSTPDLRAVAINGTSLTFGTEVTSGAPSGGGIKVMPVSATTALMAYPAAATGAGASGARVISLSDVTTLTVGAQALTASTAMRAANASPTNFFFPFGDGVHYLYGATDSADTTIGYWFVLKANGTTAVWSAAVSVTNYPGPAPTSNGTINSEIAVPTLDVSADLAAHWAFAVSPTQILLRGGSGNGGMVLATNNAGTLAMSAPTAAPEAMDRLLVDFSTKTKLYTGRYASGTNFREITVVSGAPSFGTAVALWPSGIQSPTLNGAGVNYSGTWYAWANLPRLSLPYAADKYLSFTGTNTLTSYGSFS